jgi:glycosyltransferase involved in cell wall biosynthesis
MAIPRKLLLVVNDPAFFLSHRLPLAVAAQRAGFEVHVATMPGDGVDRIRESGFAHHTVPMSRSGIHPLAELRSLLALIRLFRQIRPTVVHLVTIKPVIYGGIAARVTGVHGVVAAISGLGFVFVRRSTGAKLMRRAVGWLYHLALGHANLRVIFQNPDDQERVSRFAGLKPGQAVLIRGSGVNLSEYQYVSEPIGTVVVTMAARLLKDKGVFEFVDAARSLKQEGTIARFCLAGSPDPGNPATCTESDLQGWRNEGVVELLGYRSDIASLFAASHVVVLPSYREGLPRVLIEAAACGRAVVTTDVPGCRDAIQAGITGLLVPMRDSAALAQAIKELIENSVMRQNMGNAARAWAEREFNIQNVIEKHLLLYQELSGIQGGMSEANGCSLI